MPPPVLIYNLTYMKKKGKYKGWFQIEKKKMGRPTENPKSYRESFRLSESDMQKIKICMEKKGISKTDVIRMGIDKVYQETVV